MLPSIGVQVKTTYFLGYKESAFFDKSCIEGIVIIEGITMVEVFCAIVFK